MNTGFRTTVIAVVTALVVVGTLGPAAVGAAGDVGTARDTTAGQVSTAAGETCGFEGQRRITNESTAALPPTASPAAVAARGDDRLVVGINGTDFGARETTAWLVRNGAVVDQAALGPVGREAAAPDVVATADGGYVVTGTIGGVESDSDAFVAKLGADLASEWFVRISTPASDTGAAIVRAPGGGYTALVNQGSSRLRLGAASNGSSGTTDDADGAEVRPAVEIVRPISGDVRLVHVAGDGTRVWNRTIASPDARAGVALAVGTNDSGYLVGGASYPDGGQLQPRGTTDGVTAAATTDQAFLLRTNGTGAPAWNRTYGASAGPTVEVADVRSTGDGYVAAGTVDGSNGTDPWLVEVDDGGAVQRSRSFGRSDVDEAALSVGVTDPGEYLVGGFGIDASGQPTSWLFETGGDVAGNGTWWRESIDGTDPGTNDVERVGGDAFLVVGSYGGSVEPVSTGTDGVSTAATALDGPGVRRIQLGGDQPFPDGIDGLAPPTNTGPEPGYEDVDGDGKFTFLDVVAFNLAPPSALDADRDAAAVDYDCSGTVDFMDVVELLFRL
jgi:hypothetical protein